MWVTAKQENQTIKINTDFVALMYPENKVLLLSSGTELSLSDEDYNEIERTMFPKRKAYAKDDTEAAEFLNQLHQLTGGKNSAILTPGRRAKLDKLLKSMTRDQLIIAATNIGKDAWLQGENDKRKRWGTIDYLLRPDRAAHWAEQKPEDRRKKMF